MTGENRERLLQAGINVAEAMDRFMGNEILFFRFLKKLPEDKSFQLLKEAMEKGDMHEAFKAAHTLKGVTGNLSIDIIHSQLAKFVESLRMNNADDALEQWPKLKQDYLSTIEVIQKI